MRRNRKNLPAWLGIAVLLTAMAIAGTLESRDETAKYRIEADVQGEPQLVQVNYEKEKKNAEEQYPVRLVRTGEGVRR